VTKEANEGWAAIYWQDYQIPSVGLRPFFVYGPGRDQGVSSTPTKAMAAAAVGRPYHVSFGGTDTYHHADDVARVFIQAARTMPEGAPVYNLGGTVNSVAEVISAIERAVPESKGTITANTEPLFTPDGVQGKAVESLLGPLEWRSLEQGVQDTVDVLRAANAAGRLDADRAVN
jgi:nucleoside-diphosphate-sugar epimerase